MERGGHLREAKEANAVLQQQLHRADMPAENLEWDGFFSGAGCARYFKVWTRDGGRSGHSKERETLLARGVHRDEFYSIAKRDAKRS